MMIMNPSSSILPISFSVISIIVIIIQKTLIVLLALKFLDYLCLPFKLPLYANRFISSLDIQVPVESSIHFQHDAFANIVAITMSHVPQIAIDRAYIAFKLFDGVIVWKRIEIMHKVLEVSNRPIACIYPAILYHHASKLDSFAALL